jgi:hypothetical protein
MYTQKKSIENTHIVRERDRKRFRELLAVLSLGVPIGLFLLLFTWQNLEVIRLGHDATRLQKQQKDLETANKSLQLELDRLTALDAVEKQATGLGFQPADPKAIVTVQLAVGSGQLAVEPKNTANRQPPTANGAAGAR